MKKKILMIVGSMRNQSFNRQLAQKIAAILEDKAEVSFLEYADLPYMNQDIEFPAPEAVKRVRSEVKSSDGIWVVTPEYNSSYPGVLKNLLDWLSRPLEANNWEIGTAVKGKKVTISSAAGKSAGAGARGKLADLLEFMQMEVMGASGVGIALDSEAFQTNKVILSDENKTAFTKQTEEFMAFINS